ncbi:AfsR/SARP family transcriptional regulator [Kitasatospora azatica]|uniref:AfsR/SARP family transcriptional regulator n=1 Tax=Kitasatospora azatica TaxID=58347 RepID=UPI00068E11B3|nr:AfsR/SARP family transcriptional regulator [Kitasatospora azatica]
MEFSLLGPLEVSIGEERVELGSGKPRFLLAALLCLPNSTLSTQRLTEALWWGNPPRTAAKNLQVNIHYLRKALQRPGERPRVLSRPGGYLLALDPQEIDLGRFEALAGEAAAAARRGELERADALFQRALALWRGRPFDGMERSPLVQQESIRLAERHLVVAESAIDVRLGLGQYDEALAALDQLVAAHPFRERLRAQQMIALYRTGRQVEALLVFDAVRRLLVEELGLQPGVVLQRLQQAVIEGRREVDVPGLNCAPRPVQLLGSASQLPPGAADFVGRRAVVAELRELLAPEPSAPSEWTLLVVSGPGGAGKSTLVNSVAREVCDGYSGGLLYIDLRAPDGTPCHPTDALAELLRATGLPSEAVPELLADRIRLYRERLHGRRILILLDNASTEAQVRPLLPTTGSCATVVTSCSRLSGLTGGQLLEIGELDPAEAVDLLARIAGACRVGAEPAAADRIVRACGLLPLAVRIAGARLVSRPHWPLARLAELLESPLCLDELSVGDLDLRAYLSRCLAGAEPSDLRLTAGLGTLAAAGFTLQEAADLLGLGAARVDDLLDRLCDLRLVRRDQPHRDALPHYRIPPVVRQFALRQAAGI